MTGKLLGKPMSKQGFLTHLSWDIKSEVKNKRKNRLDFGTKRSMRVYHSGLSILSMKLFNFREFSVRWILFFMYFCLVRLLSLQSLSR
jgi:hypothetical protein